MKKPKNKLTILKGEGVNQHTLYGDFSHREDGETIILDVAEDSVLRHETPSGKFAEHQSLRVEKGQYITGKQVEYNPFSRTITRVWD